MHGPFSTVTRQGEKIKGDVRHLSKKWSYKKMPNGEKILQSWMVYLLISEKLYCFCCRLFTVNVTEQTSKFVTGFQQWWKLSPKLHNHEIPDNHLDCLEKWKTLEAGLKLCKTIDVDYVAVLNRDKKNGGVSCTVFFQHPVLKEHLMIIKQSTSATVKASVTVSYLSPETQNEFITKGNSFK
ncbi:zinc finger MYM-type protein 5-like [Hydra vulgaris]|uniref:Zinc finger MYM-type protein 5-like n=1 Tax=Hydra vulgaris TaxID=6087 RepID=A0ABM4DCV8_HYDVU